MRRTTLKREPTRDLTGRWEFALDPEDVGREDGWYRTGATWSDSRSVAVPHAWQESDDLREYAGVGWYRRTFDLDGVGPNERALLYFGAVDYEATVWVNGERVGADRDGYLPFRLDATDAVVEGTNTVVVRVRDPADLSEIPHGKQGPPWYTRVSGIWQRAAVAVVPATRVTSVRATPDLDADAVSVDVSATTADGVDTTSLSASIRVLDGGDRVASADCEIGPDGTGSAVVALDDPVYWTPDSPHLYDIEVALERGGDRIDEYADSFGMRSVECADGRLLLNGDPLPVRGALDQGYYPDELYRPVDLDDFEDEIRTAKDLGFNLLRKHIKPAHPRFLDAADRLGILVWEEPANPDVYSEASREAVRSQFAGLVERDYNRPSVVLWSLYNEEWGIGGSGDDGESLWTDREKQEFLASFYRSARERDPTRPICDNSGWAHVATDVNDYHEYFVVPDRAEAWRERLDEVVADPAGNYAATETDPESAPLLVSEFGTWGLPSVARLEDHYGGDPHWFDHDFLTGLKSPAGVRERFAESHLSDAFDDLDDLAEAWQRRQFRSVAECVRDMRVHDGVAGYVLTEWTDVEWEFNGVLDYLREPKSFREDFARVNAPVAVYVDPDSHVLWDDETLRADLVVVNDTGDPIDDRLRWEAFGETGEASVRVDGHDVERLAGAVSVSVPDADGVECGSVTVTATDRDVAGEAPITVASRGVSAATDATVYADDEALRARLADRGHAVADDLDAAEVAVLTRPDDARALADSGGTVLYLPDAAGRVPEVPAFELTDLPETESWNLCASFVSQSLLPDVDRVPGWAFEGLYPFAVVSDTRPDDDVFAGYAEGWVANDGAIALSREHGAGRLAVCTLRIADAYGDHPTATAVLASLLDRVV